MSSLVKVPGHVKTTPVKAETTKAVAIGSPVASRGPVPTTRLVAILDPAPDGLPDNCDLAEMRAQRATSRPIRPLAPTQPPRPKAQHGKGNGTPTLSLAPSTLVLEPLADIPTLESLTGRVTPPHGILVAPEPPNVGTEPDNFAAWLDRESAYYARQGTVAGNLVANLLRVTAEDVRCVQSSPEQSISASVFNDRWDAWAAWNAAR